MQNSPSLSTSTLSNPAKTSLPSSQISSSFSSPIDRDGGLQVVRLGWRRNYFGDLYHFLLKSSWSKLLFGIPVLFFILNGLFALLYLLGGPCIENARPGSFLDHFFFSVQTMATIGYGKMVPLTTYANLLMTVETLVGVVGMALMTGIMFAKFSRPTARILFSKSAVIVKRDGVESLMFRLANERGNQIVEAQLRVILVRSETTAEGESVRRFYELPLSRDRNVIFASSWTAVHPVTKESPLYGQTKESLLTSYASFIVSAIGIDDTFSQTIHARHTYRPDDIHWKHRFVDILTRLPDGRMQVDYLRFHEIEPAS